MNKQEKLIAMCLGLVLLGWLGWTFYDSSKQAEARAREAAAAPQTAEAKPAVEAKPTAAPVVEAKAAEPAPTPVEAKPVTVHAAPEQTFVLENARAKVEISSWGAVVKRVVMKDFATKPGDVGEDNPPIAFDFSGAPALALEGIAGLAADADWTLVGRGDDFVALRSVAAVGPTPLATRRIRLTDDYRLMVEETFQGAGKTRNALSLGAVVAGNSRNENILSIDSWIVSDEKGKSRVVHHGDEGSLKELLVGSSGGCSGKPKADGVPLSRTVEVPGARDWIAVKNRFFTTAFVACSETNAGFQARLTRDGNAAEYVLKSVGATVAFESVAAKRDYTFYVGPKKQSLLWDHGMRDVMEFGMWRWICYPMVWILNLFNSWIPNYGVAIILLTILVRILFWPLTHKSTVGMRRMQEIQPKMKALQAQFKDNPQRLQQETWALYRAEKVNPMSSCLPMLVQIPVFIALFTVLRSAVELRYAPFLWIADLSEPEGLGATSWFPFFGGLNILPILMAVSTALQSAFTPSTGDKSQQRMMMIMMPAMMLFMFYSFPSALSLYWFLSNLFSIGQMWWIRRKYGTPAASAVVVPDAVEMPTTRQMRRHQG